MRRTNHEVWTLRQGATAYIRMLTRQSEEWSNWEHCCQARRPLPTRYEFRRSTPLFMLAAIAVLLLALDFWFFGFLSESGQWLRGALTAASVPIIFLVGRGTIIDGSSRQVTRWWGWVQKPLLRRSYPFTQFSGVEVAKKLGVQDADPNTGRTVSRPLYLTRSDGRRILLMTCTWVDGARAIAAEIARMTSLPLNDLFPNDNDVEG